MEVDIEDAKALLARTPAVLSGLLGGGIPRAWLNCREKPKTFSPLDVLGHLIYGEQVDWLPRIRIILEQGEGRPFDQFDRFGFEDLIAGKSADELLDIFATRRNQN